MYVVWMLLTAGVVSNKVRMRGNVFASAINECSVRYAGRREEVLVITRRYVAQGHEASKRQFVTDEVVNV